MKSLPTCAQLERIMRKAGDILHSYWGTNLNSHQKKDDSFATDADLASEKYLIQELAELMPEASFYTEESGAFGPEHAEYQWVIDPLDGTTNFAHHIPYFCISVALTHNNEPIIAAIYQPVMNEFYFAHKGHGATLNGKPLKIEGSAPDKPLVAIGLPYGGRKKAHPLELVQEVAREIFAMRHFGAVALDLANLAAGRIDGLFFVGLSWWDVAAGMLLVTEAGGMVSEIDGTPVGPDYSNCLAGQSAVYEQLRAILAHYRSK